MALAMGGVSVPPIVPRIPETPIINASMPILVLETSLVRPARFYRLRRFWVRLARVNTASRLAG